MFWGEKGLHNNPMTFPDNLENIYLTAERERERDVWNKRIISSDTKTSGIIHFICSEMFSFKIHQHLC